MHPVLIYTLVFIPTLIGSLLLFDKYQLGSFYMLLIIASVITAILGKLLVNMFPSVDPMSDEIAKEQKKVYANQYKREIQYLFNIVQPDPKLQPNPKRLSGSLEDCFSLDKTIMHTRLKQYFGEEFDLATNLPLAEMVEKLKSRYKNWPDG